MAAFLDDLFRCLLSATAYMRRSPSPNIFGDIAQNKSRKRLFWNFSLGLSTAPTGSGHDSTSNLQVSCPPQTEMGMPKATSCSRYDGQYISPLIPRQQTSHVQQDHPRSGGVLNSFVLPARRWVPPLLQYRVNAPRINTNAANRLCFCC